MSPAEAQVYADAYREERDERREDQLRAAWFGVHCNALYRSRRGIGGFEQAREKIMGRASRAKRPRRETREEYDAFPDVLTPEPKR